MSRVVLSVESLKKSYGQIQAVSDLSFSVKEGEIFCLLGPNGSGKSTTLESVLGTKKLDSGNVLLLGLNPEQDRRKVFKKVGVQFQDSAWQTGIRVGELCESTACLYNPVPDWQSLLQKFDLEKRIKTAVQSLSGGERQKLAILLACMHKPEIVFLDELTTGLDPVARRETWQFIKQLKESGTTVVLTSHFMDEVEFLADKVLVIKDGRAVAEGTVGEIQGSFENLEEAYINLVTQEGGVAI